MTNKQSTFRQCNKLSNALSIHTVLAILLIIILAINAHHRCPQIVAFGQIVALLLLLLLLQESARIDQHQQVRLESAAGVCVCEKVAEKDRDDKKC